MSKNSLQIEYASLASLRDNARSARRHTKKKIAQLAESIRKLGFNVPLIVGPDGTILAGHARAAAARMVGMDEVPIVRVTHLNEVECRAFMLADNQFALNACWDFEVLATELSELVDIGFDTIVTGFSVAEIDLAICGADEANSSNHTRISTEDVVPAPPATAVTRFGDKWLMGRHQLVCGDARDPTSYKRLLNGEVAHIVFTDPPYNVSIPGHVSGQGKVAHDNFAMGCGEMSEQEFIGFLALTLSLSAQSCRDGSIAFVCMDWRHYGELAAAGKEVFSELKNICVWNKLRGGMGTFYRSQHELIFVFKVGTAPHTNNFGLGETGRYRTNVWDHPGVNAFSSTRAEELEMHPTVKPVALIMEALKDCSRRGEVVLDPFAGSGSTAIAAEKCGRAARLVEFDPRYCDTIIGRYQKLTGKSATLASSGQTFEDVAEERVSAPTGQGS